MFMRYSRFLAVQGGQGSKVGRSVISLEIRTTSQKHALSSRTSLFSSYELREILSSQETTSMRQWDRHRYTHLCLPPFIGTQT